MKHRNSQFIEPMFSVSIEQSALCFLCDMCGLRMLLRRRHELGWNFFDFSVMFRPPTDTLPSFTINFQVKVRFSQSPGLIGLTSHFHFLRLAANIMKKTDEQTILPRSALLQKKSRYFFKPSCQHWSFPVVPNSTSLLVTYWCHDTLQLVLFVPLRMTNPVHGKTVGNEK